VASNQKVGVFLDFENSEDNNLGMPLPAGVVRVYMEDSSGAQQFIGEDRIDHTPRDEKVRIKMGDAFDVVGDRRQMDWSALGNCVSESSWEVHLRNHKDEDVEVEVVEPIGGEWRILSSTHTWKKLDAHTFNFNVKIPARRRKRNAARPADRHRTCDLTAGLAGRRARLFFVLWPHGKHFAWLTRHATTS
jgi:hypothetical protein